MLTHPVRGSPDYLQMNNIYSSCDFANKCISRHHVFNGKAATLFSSRLLRGKRSGLAGTQTGCVCVCVERGVGSQENTVSTTDPLVFLRMSTASAWVTPSRQCPFTAMIWSPRFSRPSSTAAPLLNTVLM